MKNLLYHWKQERFSNLRLLRKTNWRGGITYFSLSVYVGAVSCVLNALFPLLKKPVESVLPFYCVHLAEEENETHRG